MTPHIFWSTFKDLDRVLRQKSLQLDKACFPSIFKDIDSEKRILMCASVNNRIVGITSCYVSPNYLVEFMEVAKEERHHGIGRAMIEELFKKAKTENVEVAADGFTEDGRRFLIKELERCGRYTYIGRA